MNDNETKRDSFLFYRSFYEAMKNLPKDVKVEVFDTIMEYVFNGMNPEPDKIKPFSVSIFTLIKPVIDSSEKRRKCGSKGGAPKGNGNAKKTTNGCISDENKTTNGCISDEQKNNQKQPTDNQKQPIYHEDKGIGIKDKGIGINEFEKEKEKAFADSLNFDVRRYGDDWREVFVLWMYFKHENGKPYKTQTSVNAMMKQLHEIAGGDLQVARKVVEQSMANNYSGFFPLMKTKTQKNGTSYQGDSTLGEEFERKV